MPRIFVSYAQEDREAVSPYIAGLQAANFEVWWDGDLRGGDDWSESIEAELKRSDSVVIFWSKHSVESPWVRIEAHYGKQHQSLVPIRLDDVELPDEYRQVQTIDGRHDASSSLGELVSAVSGILGKRRSRRLRVTAACAVIAIVLGALGTQFPALLRSDNSTPEISDIGDAWKAMLQAATLYELNTVEKQFASLKISEVDAAVAYAGLCATALRRFDLTRRDADLVMAQGNCATAVELDRDNAFTAEARGWLAHYTGKPEQALEAFQSSITLAPDSASARLGLAVALKSQGRDDEAEQLLLEATVVRPGIWRIQNELALLLQNQGRTEESIRRFELALQLSPENISILNNLGISYLFDQQYGNAIFAWNRVLEITPEADRGPTLSNVGSVYYLMRDFAAAKIAFEKASRLLGDDYRAWSNLADTLTALGEDAEALIAYRRALDRATLLLAQNETDYNALAGAATAKSVIGDDSWRSDITGAISKLPQDPEIRRLAALCYVRAGEFLSARAEYAASLKLGYPEFMLSADYQFDVLDIDNAD